MSANEIYDIIYDFLCGKPPSLRFFHFQWHGTRALRRALAEVLPSMGGRVLDLGCGKKPYQLLFGQPLTEYVGVDVAPGPEVDLVLLEGERLPVADGAFDVILCTQVLEHARDAAFILAEMRRVLRPGGTLVLSVPFLYHIHGEPHDFRRFTEYGLTELLSEDYALQRLQRLGGIGSTLAVAFLAWVYFESDSHLTTRYLRAVLLPVWIAFSALVNISGLLLDVLDGSRRFYHDLIVVARKQ